MKKLTALLLVMALLLSAGSVLAGSAEKYEIRYDDRMIVETVIPEGYDVLRHDVEDGIFFIVLIPQNESGATYALSIGPSDEYAELDRLNDLPDEQLEAYAATLYEDMNNPTVEERKTGMDTDLVLVNENGVEGDDYALLATLYKGYELVNYIVHSDGSPVTEEDIVIAVQFYTDMAFKF